MTAVTFEQAFGEFAEIAVEAPVGFTYERLATEACLYVHGGFAGPLAATAAGFSGGVAPPLEPGCIVAHWLHRFHGVPLATLAPLEGKSGTHVLVRLLAAGVLPPDLLNDPSSAQLLKFLQVVQGHQDAGRTWSNALEAAYTLVTTPPWSVLLAPTWEPADLSIGDRSAPAPVDA